MIETYLTLQDHYRRVLELIAENPYEVYSFTYSTGRTMHDREVADGPLAKDLNWFGMALSELDRRVGSKQIKKGVIITTEPPQECEILEVYKNIDWRQHDANHSKGWVFRYHRPVDKLIALVGSRNLTSTVFQELTVELWNGEAAMVLELAKALYQQSVQLDGQQDWFKQADEVDL